MSAPPSPLIVGVDEARDLARDLLRGLPERSQHSAGVARRAKELVPTIGDDDPSLLVATAWLHDIGYADEISATGFHPLDGARYLRRHGWPPRLCALIAHHSGAAYVAAARGLSLPLADFPREQTALSDALTYADQTVGPNGRRMSVTDRMADMLARRGDESPNAQVHHLRGPHLLAIAERVRARAQSRALQSIG